MAGVEATGGTTDPNPAVGPEVGGEVDVGAGDEVDVGVGDEVDVSDGDEVDVGVAVAPEAVTLVVMLVVQVTRLPPALPEPLHWLTVTGSDALTVEPGPTVHVTLMLAPPLLPEPLHCVTVAPLVVAIGGVQFVVGAVPPPVPEPLH
jgi:hypothetical protein